MWWRRAPPAGYRGFSLHVGTLVHALSFLGQSRNRTIDPLFLLLFNWTRVHAQVHNSTVNHPRGSYSSAGDIQVRVARLFSISSCKYSPCLLQAEQATTTRRAFSVQSESSRILQAAREYLGKRPYRSVLPRLFTRHHQSTESLFRGWIFLFHFLLSCPQRRGRKADRQTHGDSDPQCCCPRDSAIGDTGGGGLWVIIIIKE